VSSSVDPEGPDAKARAEKRLAEVLYLDEEERRMAESPPDELKEIIRVVDYEVAPLLDASGLEISREELTTMFTEWFVRKRLREMSALTPAGEPSEQAKTTPASSSRSSLLQRAGRLGRPMRRAMRGVGILIMLIPLIFVPAYFFVSTQIPPPTASGILTLAPATPIIAPGQTQNYSVLTVTQPSSSRMETTLTTYAPQGLTFIPSSSFLGAEETASITMILSASLTVATGTYQVIVGEQEGSSVRNQTFSVTVVPALVVMQNLKFVPQFLNVTTGTTVYWVNLDSTIGCCDPGYHNVAFHTGVNITSPTMKRLDTWTFTFQSPGDYYYSCSIHPFMVAEVNVSD
jgi:plastocyanin